MATISLKDLVKNYGKVEVLHHVEGEFHDGEFIVIVGPSGCGKSTLLRMVAGLETVTSGEIFIGDKMVNNLEPADRDIAMVFQNYALYPHMTVRENMAYGLKLRKFSKSDIERRVQEAATILEIQDYLDRRPRQLSGGQRQRVAMGRAIVRDPQVFLFDEPLSNLDAKLRVQMRLEIKKLQRKLGVTSIYVTHDQVEAMTLGDRLMVLNGGYVEQFGTPIDLYEKPASIFVAGFIGSPSMNFLPGHLANAHIELENGQKIPTTSVQQGDAIFGVRPEHMIVDENGPIEVVTDLCEQLGANTLVHGVLKDGETGIVASIQGHWDYEPGSVLGFNVLPDNHHLFDKETQKRLEN
ncbi:maltose/maltodextrin import ATP-binding protein MalK [Maritalea myrionectae]|uniref:Maltose/maltodextrin import ATP-binding protein MalK n=1 Tax=Maritalea myrionectae TaxID=454601 RepID=A0A2R4MBY9_9HYPH|nr:sn-glycerol-3-phosphate import ATP-binding protein UgpC [Maritalea myrionectae]AVX03551.1 maltose/maltodextrin import ATP-binding protein MalK [Maritalea myrionectae]